MAKPSVHAFKFKKHMSIGKLGAEEDHLFLRSCFVDTGDFQVAIDTDSSHSIVLGRTGSGKSALLEKIKEECEHAIEIHPEELSLNYISNSNILSFVSQVGVNLDLFFQLLWRHIFAVELIKTRYKITNEDQVQGFFDRISLNFKKDRKRERAIEYLREWGDKFWLETDVRIQELTKKIESELKAGIKVSELGVPLTAEGAKKLSEEQKYEVSERATKIVNNVQIQKLNELIRFMGDDVFDDPQNKFYITIDKLDENWIDDSLRYQLIRALIETIKTFRNIEPVKILIALRKDLLDRVLEHTNYQGFQPEKYRDLYLPVKWNSEDLYNLVSKRVGQLMRQQYTTKAAKFDDVFPTHVGNQKCIDFIVDRTLLRPRDVIVYVNQCIELAQGRTQITASLVREAEIAYSKDRISSLGYEWGADYPLFHRYMNLLRKKKSTFKHSDISKDEIDEFALELILDETVTLDPVRKLAVDYYEKSNISRSVFLNIFLTILYRIGIIGVKKDAYSSVVWSQDNDLVLSESEAKRSSFFHIHPMIWRELGIIPTSKRKNLEEA